jgi:hypothetical protein
MSAATPYSVFKSAMVTRLSARSGLAGVTVAYDAPNETPDVRASGSWESIHFDKISGASNNVIMCAGSLVYDFDYVQVAVVQLIRPDSLGTQQAADERLEELLNEVLAEMADQQGWDMAALGLDVFDYFQATLASIDTRTGKLSSQGHGAAYDLGIRVQARRSYL